MGQSVVLRHWVWEDGSAGGPDAPVAAVSEEQVAEAQAAVAQQVSLIVPPPVWPQPESGCLQDHRNGSRHWHAGSCVSMRGQAGATAHSCSSC